MSLPKRAAEGAPATQQPKGKVRRGRPPLQKGDQRRRILDAGTDLFMAKRFDEVSLDEVARLAGVTKRTIYNSIGDKPALFLAVCEHNSASSANFIFPEIPEGAELQAALLHFAKALIAYSKVPERVALSRMMIVENSRFPELQQKGLEAGLRKLQAGIEGYFRSLIDAGMIDDLDVTEAAQLFYDMTVLRRDLSTIIAFDSPDMSDAQIAARIDVFIRGYLQFGP